MNTDILIGKIIKIDGLYIYIAISPDNMLENVSMRWSIRDYLISIYKYVYTFLPCRRKIISRVIRVYDRESELEGVFSDKRPQYVVEAKLLAIFDDTTQKIDTGINTFPIIGADVYSLSNKIYKAMVQGKSRFRLEVGTSFLDPNISIYGNPDILFGKHAGVFGNTGTGKSCSVASIIQGLRKRLTDKEGEKIEELNTRIIIFDSNDEYESAFENTGFNFKKINKSDLKIPHTILSNSEYVRLFDAAQGVQAPTLIEAITNNMENGWFDLTKLPEYIGKVIEEKANNNAFSFQQWTGWNSTMVNRIERLIENKELMEIVNSKSNTLNTFLDGDEDIFIIDSNFDRAEQDIIVYLFCKDIYKKAVEKQGSRTHYLIVFEEAHRYINEDDSQDYKLGNYYIERLAREGRKYSVSLIISSQRPSELSKTVMSQCNSFIIHRLTNRNDLEFISKTLSSDNYDLMKVIPGLEQQYAIAVGEAFPYSDIVKICNADPLPDSNDPEVIQNWQSLTKVST